MRCVDRLVGVIGSLCLELMERIQNLRSLDDKLPGLFTARGAWS